jgi:hypothetical protein
VNPTSFAATAMLLMWLGATTELAAAGKAKIEMFDREHISQGKTTEVLVVARNVTSITGASVTPAEGITIGEASETDPPSAFDSDGIKAWKVPVSVAADAPLGKRTVHLNTPQGAFTRVVQVRTHTPEISELVVDSKGVSAIHTAMSLNFQVSDEADDIPAKAEVIVGVLRPGSLLASLGPESLIYKAALIETRADGIKIVHVKPSWSGQALGPTWRTIVYIRDKDGNRSNILATTVSWQ